MAGPTSTTFLGNYSGQVFAAHILTIPSLVTATLNCNNSAGAFSNVNGFTEATTWSYTGTGLLTSGNDYEPIYYNGASSWHSTRVTVKIGTIVTHANILIRKTANSLQFQMSPSGTITLVDENIGTIGTIANTHVSGDEYSVYVDKDNQVTVKKNGASIGSTYTTSITTLGHVRVYLGAGSTLDNLVVEGYPAATVSFSVPSNTFSRQIIVVQARSTLGQLIPYTTGAITYLEDPGTMSITGIKVPDNGFMLGGIHCV